MQIDDLLILARLLRSRLALIRTADEKSADELREARDYCETLVEKLESLLEEVEAELAAKKEAEDRRVGDGQVH